MKKSEVREALFRLDNSRRRLLFPAFQSLGLSVGEGQPRILNRLSEQDHLTQKELASVCDMDVTTISRTLDKLEAAGLIRRLRNPECRRSFQIEITEQGRTTAQQVQEAFRKMDDLLWDGFEEAEMEQILAGIRKMQDNLSAFKEKGLLSDCRSE